ncbi:uncharacterized protein LOC143264441 isoform X2 [Megachile rotundata]|uniref:uncharacterized protein LOC143264441 isoform X2 n=1 Tax=Megachile rotundata TaxID=143995 RepID=UPI003FD2FAC0
MALGLANGRSKSATDILDGITTHNKDKFQQNFTENRYRTYTLKGFEEEKLRFAEKEPCTPKSTQNFVKKIIASLEKRNEACKADDEFFAKYYKRNDCSNTNMYQENLKTQNAIYVLSKSEADNNCANKTVLCSLNKKKNAYKVNDQKMYHDRYHTFQSICESNARKEFDNSGKDEDYIHKYGFSSYDRNRYRVHLQSQMENVKPCSSKKSTDNDNRSTLERIFLKSKKKEDTGRETKFIRTPSFKDFFGNMMKWRKSGNKKKPKRFMSCDHLIEQSKNGSTLSTSTSLQATVLRDCDEKSILRKKRTTFRNIIQ